MDADRPPLPPFTMETATRKARLAEDAWNSRDPVKVSLAYTVDSKWRNRGEPVTGREEIQAFLKRKWSRELEEIVNGCSSAPTTPGSGTSATTTPI